jgi:hypothetical protein
VFDSVREKVVSSTTMFQVKCVVTSQIKTACCFQQAVFLSTDKQGGRMAREIGRMPISLPPPKEQSGME